MSHCWTLELLRLAAEQSTQSVRAVVPDYFDVSKPRDVLLAARTFFLTEEKWGRTGASLRFVQYP